MSLRTARRAVPTKDGSRRGQSSWYRMPVAALRYLFVFLPLWTYYSFRQLPRWQQGFLIAIVVGLATTSVLVLLRHREKNRLATEVAEAWKDFEKASKQLDPETMKACLDRIDRVKPGEAVVRSRRASLESGEGPADDPVMIIYWLNRYIVEQRIPDAAREARKRIVTVPDDWQARCILAREALDKNQVNEAAAHLKEIPSPMAGRYPISPGELNHGLWLFQQTKLDDSSLRKYRALKIVPVLRFPDILKFDPREQIQLLECYVLSFEDIDTFEELPRYWVGTDRIAQNLLDDPSTSTTNLFQLGRLQEAQLEILPQLVAKRLLSVEQAQPLADEIQERLTELWGKVRDQDPQVPESYLGLAKLARKHGRIGEMIRILDEGIAKSSDRRKLLEAQFVLSRQKLPPTKLLTKMEELAEQYPDNTIVHVLVAEAAMVAGRLDRALEVCDKMDKVAPQELWPAFLRARVYLDQERNIDRALAILEKHEKFWFSESQAAEQYVRALTLSGKREKVPAFLNQLVDKVAQPRLALPALRVALGLGFADETAIATDKLLDRFSDSRPDPTMKELLYLVGESHYAAAEPKTEDDSWKRAKVGTGVNALKKLQGQDPNDVYTANLLTLLELKGRRALDTAERESLPLRTAYEKGTLPDPMLGTLAAVSLARHQYDKARLYSLKAIQRNPTADDYVHLALAYYYLNDPNEAKLALRQASSMPRSPRVSQELSEALSLIDGKKP